MNPGWVYFLIGLGGYILGLVTHISYIKVRGRKIYVPAVSPTSRSVTLGAVLLGILSLLTIWQVQVASDRQARCNVQFQETFEYNSTATQQESQLDDKLRELYQQHEQDLNSLLAALDTGEGTDSPRVREAIEKYSDSVESNDRETARLEEERQILRSSRKPYPSPQCSQR